MLPPAVPTSTGTEMAYSLSSIRYNIGSFRFDAVFSDYPELAFAGGSIAAGNINHLVAVELYVLELAIIAGGFLRRLGIAIKIASRFGAAYSLQKLRSRRRNSAPGAVLARPSTLAASSLLRNLIVTG